MAEIVRAALAQQRWTGDKQSMVASAVELARQAAAEGAQVLCFQELFFGPYFCQLEDPRYQALAEPVPAGPTGELMRDVARDLGIVLVVPVYEEEQPGLYYNTAFVVDADGRYLGKYRKNHIPQVHGFLEKYYFRPGNLGSELAAGFAEGARRVDASGRLVLPGAVDVHTHMEMPFGGTRSSDTFETGTRAAAFGGTTTIVDFAVQRRGESLRQGLDAWRAKAEGACAVDYGFHMIVSDVNEQTCKEMDTLVGEGVTSFKLFMAYPGVFYSTDGEILTAMQRASGNGATVMMHAENGIAIDVLVAEALARGETSPRFHGLTRPDRLEAEATHRAIVLARVAGAPLYVVHLSTGSALEAVAEARQEGQNAFAETCPQYLFLSEDDLAREGFEGAKYVCSPPLRAGEQHAALWRGLRNDDLSVVSTDHCPFCFKEQKELGVGDFSRIPNGIPGVEHRLDLTYQGVLAGELTAERWVELNATAPARLFGLHPRKGVLAPGADADVVVYDPAASQTISAATHHMNVDYSAYEGRTLTGRVETVLSRGRVVVERGSYLGERGHGRFLARATNGCLR